MPVVPREETGLKIRGTESRARLTMKFPGIPGIGRDPFGEGIMTEQEINIIRGKMLVAAATKEKLHTFLKYVTQLESMVEEASIEDFYGIEGWRRRVFGD